MCCMELEKSEYLFRRKAIEAGASLYKLRGTWSTPPPRRKSSAGLATVGAVTSWRAVNSRVWAFTCCIGKLSVSALEKKRREEKIREKKRREKKRKP